MALTKADLVEKISVNGLSKNQSSYVKENLLELMQTTLESGEDILISGFGPSTFLITDTHGVTNL